MSILDDAIREHLELKRAHGADESELKRLEDEAFGPAERPGQASEVVDPFAEAPTEFLATPADGEESGGRRMPNIADLQEPPPAPEETEDAKAAAATDAKPAAETGEPAAPGGESTPAAEAAADGPAVEEHPAMEHEAVAPAEETPSAELRTEIGEQPTQMFDVEQQLFEDTAESASPSDEQLIDAERTEPRVAPVPEPDDDPADEFDEFFSEQRLSDELNQALEAPLPDEPGAPPSEEFDSPFLDPEAELGPAPDRTAEQPLPDDSTEHELPSAEHDLPPAEPSPPAAEQEELTPEPGHVDALEDTPEFLEDKPEDEDAWFEQRPPKDFDFGD
jgi:hypothetical protein